MPHLLISGGSRGIGRACVELFAGKGYKVSSLSRTGTPEDPVDGVFYIKCDVKDNEAVKESVNQAIKENGPVDVLISNAGISVSGLAQDFRYQDYRDVMDTNFGGLFNCYSRHGKTGQRRYPGHILYVGTDRSIL